MKKISAWFDIVSALAVASSGIPTGPGREIRDLRKGSGKKKKKERKAERQNKKKARNR